MELPTASINIVLYCRLLCFLVAKLSFSLWEISFFHGNYKKAFWKKKIIVESRDFVEANLFFPVFTQTFNKKEHFTQEVKAFSDG